MTESERRYASLMRLFPPAYRRARGAEMLAVLMDSTPPDRRWPQWREVRGLILGALRSGPARRAAVRPGSPGGCRCVPPSDTADPGRGRHPLAYGVQPGRGKPAHRLCQGAFIPAPAIASCMGPALRDVRGSWDLGIHQEQAHKARSSGRGPAPRAGQRREIQSENPLHRPGYAARFGRRSDD